RRHTPPPGPRAPRRPGGRPPKRPAIRFAPRRRGRRDQASSPPRPTPRAPRRGMRAREPTGITGVDGRRACDGRREESAMMSRQYLVGAAGLLGACGAGLLAQWGGLIVPDAAREALTGRRAAAHAELE